ncbi:MULTISPECIES: hypothetical protein [Shewanella]|nr:MULTISPECIES: hypothetical protein [Shewanella]
MNSTLMHLPKNVDGILAIIIQIIEHKTVDTFIYNHISLQTLLNVTF